MGLTFQQPGIACMLTATACSNSIPFLETCNNFPNHRRERYNAKVITIIAGCMGAGNKQILFGRYALDAFNHHPKAGVSKYDDITRTGTAHPKGDFGNEHKIPFIIVWLEALASNLKQPQH
jgi:hypothetical protein